MRVFVLCLALLLAACATTEEVPAPKTVAQVTQKAKSAPVKKVEQPNIVEEAHSSFKNAPRGIRNNNQGNIENGSWTRKQPGYVGHDGRFAKFKTPAHGIAAIEALLHTYQKKGLTTIYKIVSRWAPPSENNTKAYAAFVAKEVGVGVNDKIDVNDTETRRRLVRAIVRYENGGHS